VFKLIENDYGSNQEFISNYTKLKSTKAMSELYHKSETAVRKHAHKIGFDIK